MNRDKLKNENREWIEAIVDVRFLHNTSSEEVVQIGPVALWNDGVLTAQKLALLTALRARWPEAHLRTDAWNPEAVAQANARNWLQCGNDTWVIPHDVDLEGLYPSLQFGAWILMFSTTVLTVPAFAPEDEKLPAKLRGLLESTGAGAAIASWYDDTEWLLTLTSARSNSFSD